MTIAKLLREQAENNELHRKQRENALSLAEYFENLAVDPAGDLIPDERFGQLASICR